MPLVALLGLVFLFGSPVFAQTPWQQGVEYRMEARLNEELELLEGASRIRYRNNSPDTLDSFYLHLYLNAFRPNSAWARKDLEYGIRTFQELGPTEHGFERIRDVQVGGQAVVPFYPHAPDSTIVGFRLPAPLLPDETVTVDLRWDARPSSVPRRQGRRGRQYDFAQGYPRVVVYDNEGWRTQPLYRAGEFYGEFATYDFTLEVRSDQVIGATGVPVEGDPGWAAAAVPGTGPLDLQREWYGSLDGPPCIERGGERICDRFPARNLRPGESLGLLLQAPRDGHRQVRWYAEDVHHFGWSASPDYIFEQGSWEDVAIRVLYRPGDEASWGGGVAVRRTAVALEWLDSIFGDYPYPQVTNLHRLEGGGTEFPMVIMDGSASQGLILHEVGHIYAHGILANNEWYEGWLDEGMSSFQTAWFFEENGGGPEQWEGSIRRVLDLELRGISEPVVQNGEAYAEQGVYSAMVYTKGSLVLWMLREMVGDEAMTELLRSWYERYRFRHVTSADFQAVAEEVLRMDLDWFFGQWLHTTGTVDYGIGGVDVVQGESGYWSRIELEKHGDMRMPVPIRIQGLSQVKDTVVHGMDRSSIVDIWTSFPPREVRIAPAGTILDFNPANDAWNRSWFTNPTRRYSLDNPGRPARSSLDRVEEGLLPLVWANDAGGWVPGLRLRTSILGLSEATTLIGFPAIPAGDYGDASDLLDLGSIYSSFRNPAWKGGLVNGFSGEALIGEGRLAGTLRWDWDLRRHPLSGSRRTLGVFATAVRVYDSDYLVPGRWDDGSRNLFELGVQGGVDFGLPGGAVAVDATGSSGFDSERKRYARGTLSVDAMAGLGGWAIAGRLFGGILWARNPTDRATDERWGTSFGPRERMFSAGSGDPFQRWGNPWTRSGGAWLDETGRVPGGGTLPGYSTALPFGSLGTGTLEIAVPEFGLLGSVVLRPVAFAGFGWGEALALGASDTTEDAMASAGGGVEVGLDGSPLRLRLDVPVWVSRPDWASSSRDDEVAFRLEVVFQAPLWN